METKTIELTQEELEFLIHIVREHTHKCLNEGSHGVYGYENSLKLLERLKVFIGQV